MKYLKTLLVLAPLSLSGYTQALTITNTTNLIINTQITSSGISSSDVDYTDETNNIYTNDPAPNFPVGGHITLNIDSNLQINNANDLTVNWSFQGPNDASPTALNNNDYSLLFANIVNNGSEGDTVSFSLENNDNIGNTFAYLFKLVDPTGTAFNNDSDTVDISAFQSISFNMSDLYNSNRTDGYYSRNYFFKSEGTVNEVPVPAAAWLFASALIGLRAIKK